MSTIMRRFQKVFVRDTSSAILETRSEARSVFGRISRTLVMVSEVEASKGLSLALNSSYMCGKRSGIRDSNSREVEVISSQFADSIGPA
jgi:hypothetical protein